VPPEGIGFYVSPEFLHTLALIGPAVLLTWWTLWLLGFLWRRTVWQRIGAHLREEGVLGEVRPLFLGWRVTRGQVRVDYRGGWRGVHTVVRQDNQTTRYEGLMRLGSL